MSTIALRVVHFFVLSTSLSPLASYAASPNSGRNDVTPDVSSTNFSTAEAPANSDVSSTALYTSITANTSVSANTSVTANPVAPLQAPAPVSDLAASKQRVVDSASARAIDTQRVQTFLTQLDSTSKRYNTTEKQLVSALNGLSELLTSTAKSPLYNDKQIEMIFETALHNIACPMEIDQGYHPTCNVTTVEVFAAARHPEKYVSLIKEVALTGAFTANDGRVARPPKNALLPGNDEKTYDITQPNSDKRNIASQIVQMTLINGAYELGFVLKKKTVRKPDGSTEKVMAPVTDLRYVLGPSRKKPIPNGWINLGEDLLVDSNGKGIINPQTKEMQDGPSFTQDEVVATSEMWLGVKMPYIATPYQETFHDTRTGQITKKPWVYDLPDSKRLLKAKADGVFPLGVPTIGGAHVQTIHDVIVDKRGVTWVLLDNQHGTERDGWVPLSDLHSTQKSQSIHLKPKYKPTDLSWNK